MIYNQKKIRKNICVGCGVCSLSEAESKKKPPTEREITKYYLARGIDPEKGVGGDGKSTVRSFLKNLETFPLKNVRLKASKLVWTDSGNKLNYPPLVLWNKLKTGRFLFILNGRDGGIKLDEDAFIIRSSAKREGFHAVALHGLRENPTHHKYVTLEDSKGPKHGDNGFIHLKLLDIPKEVREIWEVEFA